MIRQQVHLRLESQSNRATDCVCDQRCPFGALVELPPVLAGESFHHLGDLSRREAIEGFVGRVQLQLLTVALFVVSPFSAAAWPRAGGDEK